MNWINESVIYNIYPLGFCGAPKQNDFNLQYRLDKIYEWIPYFKEMNINAIVFNPLFESTRHGYDTIDFKQVDKRLGDNASFKKICRELHNNGIRILLDGVFNHVGRDFWAFQDVKKNLQNSQYCSWFHNLHFNGTSPAGDPFVYEGWAGSYDLVKLNLQNPDVSAYLLDAAAFWIDEFDIDGLRLDAADCVDLSFFKQLRQVCKGKKPDFWLYGEIVHGDYNIWANPDTLDSVTNYECYKGLYSSHNDHNYFEIAHSLQRQFSQGGIYKNIYTYNFVDNHDVNRIASVVKNPVHLPNVNTLMYCMPGVPSVYYGSEWGIQGTRSHHSDHDLRPCVNLQDIVHNDLLEHIKKLGFVRRNLEALKYGDFENINIQNEQLVFRRRTAGQTVYVVLNVNDNQQYAGFNTDGGGVLTDVLNNDQIFHIDNGYANIPVDGASARILVLNDGTFKLDYSGKMLHESNTQPFAKKQMPPVPKTLPVQEGKSYKHFKGNVYKVLNIATHSETLEKLVVYRDINDDTQVWARPYEMFNETIEYNGARIPRFALLKDE